jgi:ribosome biogenesis protein SSF1/2
VLETNARKVLSKKQMAAVRRSDGDGKLRPRGQPGVEKRAVKLMELGPRLKLRMTKVEEGVCGGKVMWHEFVEKSAEEVKEMEKVWEARSKEKAERKRLQKENVERKRKERGARGKGTEGDGVQAEDEDDEVVDDDDWDSEGLEGDGEMEINENKERRVAVG